MPSDHKPTAAGLSVSSTTSSDDDHPLTSKNPSASANLPFHDDEDDVNDDDPDATDLHDAPPVPWARARDHSNSNTSLNNTLTSTASRRLSTPYALHGRRASSAGGSASAGDMRAQLASLGASSLRTARGIYRQSSDLFVSLSPMRQFLVLAAAVVVLALTITLFVLSHKVWMLLGPIAASWRALPGGWLILWLLTFLVAFPPLVGYSTACTVAGFVWGMPLGWPIVATATVAGSTASFLASRTVLSSYVDRLVGRDPRFVALGQVLRHDGLGVLALVRFCPLPYSLSNGFLATVPSIRPASFAIATALASPKLLVHVFVGSRLALLADAGDTMSFGDRLVNYLSIAVGAAVGIGVGYFIYRRTMARAAELAASEARPLEDGRGGGLAGRRTSGGGAGVGAGYADEDGEDGEGARLMDPNDAAALMVDDDDISLWDAAGDDDIDFVEGEVPQDARYRDEEEAVGGTGPRSGR